MFGLQNLLRSLLFLGVIFFRAISAQAQEDDQTGAIRNIGFRVHRASIIQHSKKLSDDFRMAHPWALEAEYSWHLRNENVTGTCNCYPRAGISLEYIDFDLGDTLGRSLAGYAFIEPFIMPGRKLNFALKFGLGPAYMSSVYDETSNPDNLFFSSRISFIALFSLSCNYRITPQLALRLGANFNHISNSGIREPNLGMNFPSLNLGMEYAFSPAAFKPLPRQENPFSTQNRNRFDCIVAGAMKTPEWKSGQELYPVVCLAVNYSRILWRSLAVSVSGEWVNDLTRKALVLEMDYRNEDGKYVNHTTIGGLAGLEWMFGRIIFSQQMGYYIYSPLESRSSFYQRYGLSFKISEHVYAGLNIKAHAQDADFMDLRMGFYL